MRVKPEYVGFYFYESILSAAAKLDLCESKAAVDEVMRHLRVCVSDHDLQDAESEPARLSNADNPNATSFADWFMVKVRQAMEEYHDV